MLIQGCGKQSIVRDLESPVAHGAEDPLPCWLAEAAFAASYLLKDVDVIPDHLAKIGLADDALILRCVIERNEAELQRIPAKPSDDAAGVDRQREPGIG
jgi:uncharacterized membrane protein YkvA (DUF1232 family)